MMKLSEDLDRFNIQRVVEIGFQSEVKQWPRTNGIFKKNTMCLCVSTWYDGMIQRQTNE